MDRPDPSPPPVPASTTGTSSAAQNTTGTTQAPAHPDAGALGASSVPGAPTVAPESGTSEPGPPRPSQQQPQAPATHPTSPTESVPEQPSHTFIPEAQRTTPTQRPQSAPSTPPKIILHATQQAPGESAEGSSPQRPHTTHGTPPRSTSQDMPVPTVQGSTMLQHMPQATSPLRILEPIARPTTGSTIGGPGTDPNLLGNPPTPPPRPALPLLRMGRSTGVGILTSSAERLEDAETLSGHHELHRDNTMRSNQALPTMPSQARYGENGVRRQRTLDAPGSAVGHGMSRRSGLDWVAPAERKKTISERLAPTVENAEKELLKYRLKAKATGWTLNVAIGLQVLLGSLTTGLSAVATTGKQTAVQTTVLGALATLVASYLARARGSKEPELSNMRVRDLERFLREVKAFDMDRGHLDTDDYDDYIEHFRRRFEEMLGHIESENRGGKEKKSSPPA